MTRFEFSSMRVNRKTNRAQCVITVGSSLDTSLSEISVSLRSQDINQKIDRLRKTVSEQNHALVAIKVFFRWAQRRRYLDHSPCEGMQTIKRIPRHRVLSDQELAAVFMAAEKFGYPFGSIVQLCILTGQRRSEIAWLCRSYLSGDTITFPPSFTKNRREHIFPIGPLAQHIIQHILKQADFIFPAMRGNTVFGGWSKQKTALDQTIADAGYDVAPWTLHDLRRTFASGMAALAVRLEVIEKLLNHVSGSFSGVAGIYQRHTYMDEMRAAVAAWETRLTSLLKP
jgi:integrase